MKGCWVRVEAEGLNLERLIRKSAGAEIPIRRMLRKGDRRLRAVVPEDKYEALEQIAMEGGWRLRPLGRVGGGALLTKLGRRWGFCAALVLALCAIVVATQVMWRVTLVDAGVYAADVSACLLEQGIRAPMWKRDVDTQRLREVLEWRYPDVARIDCGWRGMTLRVVMHAGLAEGETLTAEGSSDVIALRDGLIDSVVTVAGTAQVKAGDLVRKGDVLIKGVERTSGEGERFVAARGTVMARVWDGAAIRMPVRELDTIYSGRTQTVQTVETPWFDLWQTPSADFDACDTQMQRLALGGWLIPLTIRRETRHEYAMQEMPRDLSQVKTEAGIAAMRKLRQKVGFDAVLLDKWVEYSMIEYDELQAVAVCERIIDIAVRER